MQAINPSLICKNENVASWGCRILSKLAYELANKDLLGEAWEWFVSGNGGLYACFVCLKRN